MEVSLGIPSRLPERHVDSEPDLNICFTPDHIFLCQILFGVAKHSQCQKNLKKCVKI